VEDTTLGKTRAGEPDTTRQKVITKVSWRVGGGYGRSGGGRRTEGEKTSSKRIMGYVFRDTKDEEKDGVKKS